MKVDQFSFEEDIIFGFEKYELFAEAIKALHYSKLVVVCDKNTFQYCYPKLQEYLPPHETINIKSGEVYKNIDTVLQVWEQMTAFQLDRNALIVNLGGGVVMDLIGFCAKTYKRGIRFVNIPTTLLSQVDASIGGKLGFDHLGFKNHIGLFSNPEKVFVDPSFLQTLSKREFLSGFAEVIKHALIYDRKHWKHLKENADIIVNQSIIDNHSFWIDLIRYSIKIKSDIVSQDPKEKGLRKILNFGHTVGHALESFYLDSGFVLLHGEAVALGCIAEAYLSFKKGLITEVFFQDIQSFILSIYSNIQIQETDILKISEQALHDKKNENQSIQASLLASDSLCVFNQEVSLLEIQDALNYLSKL